MTDARQTVIHLIGSAHATELALVRTLQGDIALTPRGDYRDSLERHLEETRDHARRLQQRRAALGLDTSGVFKLGVDLFEGALGIGKAVAGQALALSKAPLDLLRGESRDDRLLKNARDQIATEAFEIGTYIALERLAQEVGDDETAELAADIRADEEQMLDELKRHLRRLAGALAGAALADEDDDTTTDDAVEEAAETPPPRRAAEAAVDGDGGPQAAPAPPSGGGPESISRGPVRVEPASPTRAAPTPMADAPARAEPAPQVSEPPVSEESVMVAEFADAGAEEGAGAQIEVDPPWDGYDGMRANEVQRRIAGADAATVAAVLLYEATHKSRRGVLAAAERRQRDAS